MTESLNTLGGTRTEQEEDCVSGKFQPGGTHGGTDPHLEQVAERLSQQGCSLMQIHVVLNALESAGDILTSYPVIE